MTVEKRAIGLKGFPTPDTAADEDAYLLFLLPDGLWAQYILGACEALVYDWNWFEAGDLLPEEASEAFRLIVQQAPYNLQGAPSKVPTPFWDDATDTDDELEPADAPWYGYVTDTDAAPSTTFVEDALIWTFTGILAVGVDPGLAIAFHTVAPKLVVAIKSDPVAVVKVWFDDILQGEFTDADAVDGVIYAPAYGDSTLSGHDLYIVNATP